jgi:hypothetical protein
MNDWKKQRRKRMLKSRCGLVLGVVGGNLEEGLHTRFLEAWTRICLSSRRILERLPTQILRRRDPDHTRK